MQERVYGYFAALSTFCKFEKSSKLKAGSQKNAGWGKGAEIAYRHNLGASAKWNIRLSNLIKLREKPERKQDKLRSQAKMANS